MFGKCPRVLPVPETVDIVLGIASDHGDEGEGDQTYYQEEFAESQPRGVSGVT